MDVQVWHGFACVCSVVDYYPITGLVDASFLRHRLGGKKKLPQESTVIPASLADPRDDPFGDDENMHRRLGVNVVKRDQIIGLMHDAGRNLAGDDFLEDRHGTN